jgi:hypothetical protein
MPTKFSTALMIAIAIAMLAVNRLAAACRTNEELLQHFG